MEKKLQDDSQMMGGGGRGRGRGRGMPMRGGPPFASRGGFGRGGYDRGGGHSGNWQGPGGHRGDPSSYQEIVKVPSNKCGLVIGKGGETIIGINRVREKYLAFAHTVQFKMKNRDTFSQRVHIVRSTNKHLQMLWKRTL